MTKNKEEYRVRIISVNNPNSVYSYELLEYDQDLGFWDEVKHYTVKRLALEKLGYLQNIKTKP